MKITSVETIYLRLPSVKEQCDSGQDALIVRVHTDAGITGLGEVDSSPMAAKGAIDGPFSRRQHPPACSVAGRDLMGQDEKTDIALVKEARKGLGDDVDLMIDAALVWDAKTAIQRARAFADSNIFWLEEPLRPDDYVGYRKLSQATHLRIAAGEEESGRQGFLQLMDEG